MAGGSLLPSKTMRPPDSRNLPANLTETEVNNQAADDLQERRLSPLSGAPSLLAQAHRLG
jgi:hypothetical protein